jgi:hypothetical protein
MTPRPRVPEAGPALRYRSFLDAWHLIGLGAPPGAPPWPAPTLRGGGAAGGGVGGNVFSGSHPCSLALLERYSSLSEIRR